MVSTDDETADPVDALVWPLAANELVARLRAASPAIEAAVQRAGLFLRTQGRHAAGFEAARFNEAGDFRPCAHVATPKRRKT